MKNLLNTNNVLTVALTLSLTTLPALASSASTDASAGRDRRGVGNAEAAASYEGDAGFARTNTRTGRVNIARGVAVGVDEDGLSLSVSQAIDPKHGPSIATNFNLSIGRDGVSASNGISTASGSNTRQVSAGGAVSNERHTPVAISTASGTTGPRGKVAARTNSHTTRPQPRVIRTSSHQPRTIVVRTNERPRPVIVRHTVPVRTRLGLVRR